MKHDADFSGYVGARWPALVRILVLLGCPETAAPDVALDALARCQKDWRRIREDADVDGVVRSELLAAWDRFRTSEAVRWDTGGAVSAHDPTLAADLDALSPGQRAQVVLVRFAGAPSGGGLPPEPSVDRLQGAAARLPVLAAPTQEEITVRRRAETRRRTRRTVVRGLGAVVPVLVVALGLTWVANRSSDTRNGPVALPRLEVTRAQNPTDVVWEANGDLHLSQATIAIPPARQVASMGAGAVYSDRSGRVIRINPDGVQTVLGHEDTGTGFVSSESQGWAAWVDPTGTRSELMVVATASGTVVGRLPLPDGETVRPVAIDGDTVYYADSQGARGWQPDLQSRPAYVVEPAVLLDVAAKTRLYQVGATRLQVAEPLAGATVPLTGVGGRLSADGQLLLTRTRGDAGGEGPIAIYDTRTGGSLQTGVADDELVIDADFGTGQTVTYLIARKADRPGASDELRASFAGSLQLRTCQLFLASSVPAQCGLVATIPVSGISPVLGH